MDYFCVITNDQMLYPSSFIAFQFEGRELFSKLTLLKKVIVTKQVFQELSLLLTSNVCIRFGLIVSFINTVSAPPTP